MSRNWKIFWLCVFAGAVTIFIVTIGWNAFVVLGWLGPKATTSILWLPALLVGAIAVSFGITPEKSDEGEEKGYRPARLVRVERQGDQLGVSYPTDPNPRHDPEKNRSVPQPFHDIWPTPKQFAAATDTVPANVSQGDAMIGRLDSHGWLTVAGSLLAAGGLWAVMKTFGSENPIPFLWAAVFLFVGSIACFLASAGKLDATMKEVGEKYLPHVWFAFSLLLLVTSVMLAAQEHKAFWVTGYFWLAALSVLLAGVAMVGKLGEYTQKAMTGLGKAVIFQHGPVLGFLLWTIISGLGAILCASDGTEDLASMFHMQAEPKDLSVWLFGIAFVSAIGFFVSIAATGIEKAKKK